MSNTKTHAPVPELASALSLVIPGAGQIYAGDLRRGLALLVGLPVQAALLYGTSLPRLALWVTIGMIWAWNVLDAFLMARNRRLASSLPIFIVLLLNLVASLYVTQVHVPRLAKEQRAVMGQIARGLGSPDFAQPSITEATAAGKFIVSGPGAPSELTHTPARPGAPRITISPERVKAGEKVTVEGRSFPPGSEGRLMLLGGEEQEMAEIRTDREGSFSATFTNPRSIPGDYFVQARVTTPAGGWQLSSALQAAAPLMLQTIYLALLGTALSLIFALPLSFMGAKNLMSASPLLKTLYGLTRGVFTVLRSVEVLIIAVIAVAAVGIGPFAGVVALAVHGIGALGKLYSEAIESIEHGPIEAIRSTGANELQVVVYGVVPQVVPQFIAFTLYRWDINVRMATVIGLVGGGGIGYQLIQYMNLMQWRQAATAIWLIAGVVMLMDYASAVIREKVV